MALAVRVCRSRYEKSEGLDSQQATRDVQTLAEAGILTAVGRTNGPEKRHRCISCRS
ncbi:hypothetical protein ACR6C2_31655 [Streptomyces sp. INA 01156]